MERYREFVEQCGILKQTERRGWVQAGISQSESVAAHIFRTALLALTMPLENGVNRDKLVNILLVHDLSESNPAVGDITPLDGVPPQEKEHRERSAMEQLCSLIPNGTECLKLWEEYTRNETSEAKVAHDLDKIEWAVQVLEYERQEGRSLRGHVVWAAHKIQTETGRKIFDLLIGKA